MANTRPTRKPVAPVEALSDACREQLLTGHDLRGEAYSRDVENDPTALKRMREDWNRYRDELLREWIASRPGSRPFAWWLFDATGRRETIDGSVHPFDRPERRKLCDEWHARYPRVGHDRLFYELFYGRPRIVVGEGMVHYESEREYLARLGLLTRDERESNCKDLGQHTKENELCAMKQSQSKHR